jgi:tRNA-specific 2-thiouridylase
VTAVEVLGDSARGSEWAAVRLLVDGDRIVEADAGGLERSLTGLTLLEAAAVSGETLAVDALADALGQVFVAGREPGRIAVAMSGGVDSAVALLRAGPKAIGVTLRLWLDPAGPDAGRSCCSPAAVIAARRTCHALGRPHVTLDRREAFRTAVVQPFVDGYGAGLTPNPCSRCNGGFRFHELLEFTRSAGAEALWTGHYARVVERSGRRLVGRGADSAKDQSYMLATLPPRLLDRIHFPLGEQGKEETRDEARRAGLAVAERAESQEACFLAGDDYRSFLERQGVARAPGMHVDENGAVVGRHDGAWRFTPGQRRGLGLTAAEPLYALEVNGATNTVVVGPRSSLARRRVGVRGVLHLPVSRVEAKIRYRSQPVPAAVAPIADGFELRFEEPVFAVAPGQVAALYDRDAVVGAGAITTASHL